MRLINIILFFSCLIGISVTYNMKYEVYEVQKQIVQTRQQIYKERQQLRLYQADLAMLTGSDNLMRLQKTLLPDYVPTSYKNVVAFNGLPRQSGDPLEKDFLSIDEGDINPSSVKTVNFIVKDILDRQ